MLGFFYTGENSCTVHKTWDEYTQLDMEKKILHDYFLTSASLEIFFSSIWVFGSNEYLCSPGPRHCSYQNFY